MKCSTGFLILSLIAAAAAASSIGSIATQEEKVAIKVESNSLIVGKRQPNDKLVYQENINEKASIIGKKVILEKTIDLPKGYVITEVRALDLITDGTGAIPVVTAGGPGKESISLRFKSQRFHGIYFIVQVYAKLR